MTKNTTLDESKKLDIPSEIQSSLHNLKNGQTALLPEFTWDKVKEKYRATINKLDSSEQKFLENNFEKLGPAFMNYLISSTANPSVPVGIIYVESDIAEERVKSEAFITDMKNVQKKKFINFKEKDLYNPTPEQLTQDRAKAIERIKEARKEKLNEFKNVIGILSDTNASFKYLYETLDCHVQSYINLFPDKDICNVMSLHEKLVRMLKYFKLDIDVEKYKDEDEEKKKENDKDFEYLKDYKTFGLEVDKDDILYFNTERYKKSSKIDALIDPDGAKVVRLFVKDLTLRMKNA